MLHCTDWYFVTDVLRQTICLTLNSYEAHCLTLEDGTNRLSQNVSNYQSMLHNIPEQ